MTDAANLEFRRAIAADLSAIVHLLFDDELGRMREIITDPVHTDYVAAFQAIESDANQLLAVAVDSRARVIGCMQISFIPGLSHRGMERGQIESVRIARSERSKGVGQLFVSWAIEQCRGRGCGLVQLTTNTTREDAHRFYERLGFAASHTGYKLTLAG